MLRFIYTAHKPKETKIAIQLINEQYLKPRRAKKVDKRLRACAKMYTIAPTQFELSYVASLDRFFRLHLRTSRRMMLSR